MKFLFCKSEKKKDTGTILLGFAVLMFGMDAMSGAMEGLKDNEAFTRMLTVFSNPIMGILFGTAFTAIIQSSSASVGVLQALALSCFIPYSTAIPVILGQNIGTCVTALISSAGAQKNAKRAAVIHLLFNVMGTIIFGVIMFVFFMINKEMATSTISSVEISIFHTFIKH